MKIKFYILSLIAVLAMMVSCTEKFEPTYLDDIKVSTSYVSIPVSGGSATMELTTAGDYEITGMPEWLTVSPTTGGAGTSTITFSAESTVDGRSTDAVRIKVGESEQIVNVIQGLSTVSNATCAEVAAGPDAKTYRTKGVVTAIANTTYGNFYINDGTGELYIYGTLYQGKTQNNPIANNNIEVGDEVTVEGPKKTYNGTIELIDVTVVKVEKSLIKVDSVTVESLPSDGGDFSVFLINKGNGLYVDVPEDAQSWLSIKSVQGNTVTFHAASNTAGPRNATLVFKTVSGGKDYTAQTEITQEGLSGTADVPFTPEEAIAFCSKLSGQTAQSYYVKGIVSKIVGEFSEKYGNGSFWISSDGVFNDDLSKDFEAYQVYWFDGEKWVEGNGQVSVGDEVLICGPLTTYKGTAETAGKGAAHIVSINGISKAGYGLGSLAAPFTAEGAVIAANAGVTAKVYVAGKISQIASKGDFTESYGNGSFFISDDGTYYGDQSKDFEAYQVYWLGGNKWVEANGQPAIGSDVIIYGPLTVYKGTAETQGKGAAYIYSINGKTE